MVNATDLPALFHARARLHRGTGAVSILVPDQDRDRPVLLPVPIPLHLVFSAALGPSPYHPCASSIRPGVAVTFCPTREAVAEHPLVRPPRRDPSRLAALLPERQDAGTHARTPGRQCAQNHALDPLLAGTPVARIRHLTLEVGRAARVLTRRSLLSPEK